MAVQTYPLLLTRPQLQTLQALIEDAAAGATPQQLQELEHLAEEVHWTLCPIEDAEFSERGRSPRFGPGWWILPSLALFAVAVVLSL